jgi:hypothetical protein
MPDVSFSISYDLAKKKQNTSDQSIYLFYKRVRQLGRANSQRNQDQSANYNNSQVSAIFRQINRQNSIFGKTIRLFDIFF